MFQNKHLCSAVFFYKKLDALVVLSEADARFYKQKGIENIYVIPNEISFYPEKFSDCLSPRIIAVGRLSPVKNFDYMVEVAGEALAAYPEWELEIVGEGALKENIDARIKQLGLERQVTIQPFTANIMEHYRNASIYLLTSETEGFPMVLLEAQALWPYPSCPTTVPQVPGRLSLLEMMVYLPHSGTKRHWSER